MDQDQDQCGVCFGKGWYRQFRGTDSYRVICPRCGPTPATERSPEYLRAVEAMLDFLAEAADGKDDDEIVFLQSLTNVLAEAIGIPSENAPKLEPMRAGTIRRNVRKAKEALALEADAGRCGICGFERTPERIESCPLRFRCRGALDLPIDRKREV